jgi:penicillin-binding protein 2
MLVFDVFKDEGGRLHVITWVVAGGMLVLLAGLWFVQVVFAQRFEIDLQRQSIRHVRTPAIRGRILDRNGLVLADDKPRYNATLYLEDLQRQFDTEYSSLRKAYVQAHPEAVKSKGKVTLVAAVRQQLQWEADCAVVSNITWLVSASLGQPRLLNNKVFLRHYREHPYVPFPIVPDLAPKQVAILAEQWLGQSAVEMETQPVRDYPHENLAANLLGYVQHRDTLEGGEFAFDMPDYQGISGVEKVYDDQLSGLPGDKSILINNLNYRQREEIQTPNLPGNDVCLTIDLPLQQAAEKALAAAPGAPPIVRGAVVVMDPRNGDILALVSAPAFDPNLFALEHRTREENERLNDPKYKPQFNRAVSGAYPPGSTFKIITSVACLEDGLDPNETFDSPGEYRASPTSRPIHDTAGPGRFNFKEAFYRSSNTYFIMKGKDHLRKILEVAKRFHLGEKTGISTHQEVAGDIPGPEKVGPSLRMSAPDICIGQEITATPLQLAGMISVIANGGTLYVPRVASHAQSPETGEIEELDAPGRVHDHVRINARDLALIREAMVADTEHPAETPGPGSAYKAFHHAGGAPLLGSFRVAGKTGTAEVKSPGSPYRRVTWFDSYGPCEDPRYVVVVMVEDGGFGGTTCAPVAEKIYEAILKQEQASHARPPALAQN